MDTETRSWWYVIHTKPKQEARALLNLSNQGYECFLPMHKKQVVRRATVVTQAEPLFSRYLFIEYYISCSITFSLPLYRDNSN